MPHATDFSVNRRHFLAGGLAAATLAIPGAAAAFSLPGLGAQGGPLEAAPPQEELFGLARSLREEHDYEAEVNDLDALASQGLDKRDICPEIVIHLD